MCDEEIPSILTDQQHTIIAFDADILSEGKMMEYIGSMTCPANMVTSEGTMNLGNHDQWMDAGTIESCHVEFQPDIPDKGPVNQLTAESYIVVKDYKDDTNSFLAGDYLIADPDTMTKLPKECGPLYKIISTETIDVGTEYDTLKLSVQLPESPMEYIYEIDASGTGPDLVMDHEGDASKRRMGWDVDITAETAVDVLDMYWGPWDYSYRNSGSDDKYEAYHEGYTASYVCSLYSQCLDLKTDYLTITIYVTNLRVLFI